MSFFPEINDMLNRAKNLDDVKAWLYVLDRESKDEIIRLNTEEQLFNQGIDAASRSLGQYTEFTKKIKRSKGQRIDHVTLKDTGAFYNSFIVIVKTEGLEIFADDASLYDRPLTEVYGIDILGLTDESETKIGLFLLPKYLEFVRSEILP